MRTQTREKIVETARRQGRVRPVELARALGIGKAALHRQLRKLVAEGRIIKEGKAPRVAYRVYDPQDEARRIAQVIRPVLERYGVTKAELFGSAAYGGMTPDSDVDVLVELSKKVSLFDIVHLKSDLEREVGRKVDVVQYKLVRPDVKKSVFEDTFGVI